MFAFEKSTNCLLLKQPGSHGGVSTLRLIRRNFIAKVNESVPPAEKPDLQLPYLDMDRARKREQQALMVSRRPLPWDALFCFLWVVVVVVVGGLPSQANRDW